MCGVYRPPVCKGEDELVDLQLGPHLGSFVVYLIVALLEKKKKKGTRNACRPLNELHNPFNEIDNIVGVNLITVVYTKERERGSR